LKNTERTDVRSDERAGVPVALQEDGETVEDQDDREGDELYISEFDMSNKSLTPKYDK